MNKKPENYPMVLIGVFIEQATPFLPEFLSKLNELDYPKKMIHLIIRNTVSSQITLKFRLKVHSRIQKLMCLTISKVSSNNPPLKQLYLDRIPRYCCRWLRQGPWIEIFPNPSCRSPKWFAGMEIQELCHVIVDFRKAEIVNWKFDEFPLTVLFSEQCVKHKCDYFFNVDSNVHLDNPYTLQLLIEQNRPVLSPLMILPYSTDSNFFGAISSQRQYVRSIDYNEIITNNRR